jgi:hypothetical protein
MMNDEPSEEHIYKILSPPQECKTDVNTVQKRIPEFIAVFYLLHIWGLSREDESFVFLL